MVSVPPIPAWGNVSATTTTVSSVRVEWEVENRNWHKFLVTLNNQSAVEVLTEGKLENKIIIYVTNKGDTFCKGFNASKVLG